MRLFTVTLFALLLATACGTGAATGTDAATLDADVASGTDASTPGTDAVADEVAGTDATVDAATDAASPDSGGTDAASADTTTDVAPTCSELQAKIDALKPTLTPCTPQKGCVTFEYPICNSFGCFETPVAQGSDTAPLESLASQASAAGCEGFHCGCDTSVPSFCLKGQCRQCPPDCDGSCDEMTSAFTSVAHAANWCGTTDDCTTLGTALCPVADLPCGGLFINKYAKLDTLQAIHGGFSKACGPSTCKCAVPSDPICVAGKCVAK